MSTELKDLQKRTGNAIFQVRCDRRTIATLVQHYSNFHPIASMSQVIRLSLEFCERAILAAHPDYELLSVEDADEYLSSMVDKYNPNPSGRNLTIFKQQLERESALLEGRNPVEAPKRVTKAMLKSQSAITPALVKETFKKIVSEGKLQGESLEEAQQRRESELEEMKKGLGLKEDSHGS